MAGNSSWNMAWPSSGAMRSIGPGIQGFPMCNCTSEVWCNAPSTKRNCASGMTKAGLLRRFALRNVGSHHSNFPVLGDALPDLILSSSPPARNDGGGAVRFGRLDQPQDPHLAIGVIDVAAAVAPGHVGPIPLT